VLLCTTFAQGKDNPAATANYERALQQLKSGDLKTDFKALRLNCAASKYECEADSDEIKLLFSLLNDKKFDQALKKVNQVLEKVFGCRVAYILSELGIRKQRKGRIPQGGNTWPPGFNPREQARQFRRGCFRGHKCS
jgi:hypothetical protein